MIAHIMPCREAELEFAVAGARQGLPALVGVDGGRYCAPGFTDDVGLYYWVPLVSRVTGLDSQQATAVFLVGMVVMAAVLGLVGLAFYLRTWPGRAAGLAAMLLLAAVTIRINDVYVTAFACVAGVLPGFLALRRSRHGWACAAMLLPMGLVLGLANQVRGHAGTTPLLFIGFLLLVDAARPLRRRLLLAGLLLFGFLLPGWCFDYLQTRRDAFLASHQPENVVGIRSHPKWHAIYLGLGFLANPHGIRYEDRLAAEVVAKADPAIAFCSPEYERVLRDKVFEVIRTDPHFVLKTLFAKAGVMAMMLIEFANLGLLAGWCFPKERKLDLAFLLAMLFASLPGLLVMPHVPYCLAYVSLAVLWAVLSIDTAAAGLLSRRKAFPPCAAS